MIYMKLLNKTILVENTIEFLCIAGNGIMSFVLDECSGSKVIRDILLVDDVGGVIVETILDMHGKYGAPFVPKYSTYATFINDVRYL